jgi:hypothetical protein
MKGGQRRTAVIQCGYSVKGSLRDVEYKLKLHTRVCEWCKENNKELGKTIAETPFNVNAAKINGWNGIQQNKVTKDKISNLIIDRSHNLVITRDVITIEQARNAIETQLLQIEK